MSDKDVVIQQPKENGATNANSSSPTEDFKKGDTSHIEFIASPNGSSNFYPIRPLLQPQKNSISKTPTLSINIPQTPDKEITSSFDYKSASPIATPNPFNTLNKANLNVLNDSSIQHKTDSRRPGGSWQNSFEFSPPNTSIFQTALISPPKRTNSINSNKSTSLSPPKRSNSIKSNCSNSSSTSSPVIHSVTGLPSPIVFEYNGKSLIYESVPLSWNKRSVLVDERSQYPDPTDLQPTLISLFEDQKNLNENKVADPQKKIGSSMFQQNPPLPSQLVLKKNLPIDRVKQDDSGRSQVQQKRFFSTPLPKDSTLISTALNNDNKLASGIINDSVIRRESHNNINVMGISSNDSKENLAISTRNLKTVQEQPAQEPPQSQFLDPYFKKFIKTYHGFDMNQKPRAWKFVKFLGRGSFSTVILGELVNKQNTEMSRVLDLVAVKITDLPVSNRHQDRANRARIESSLQRELDILTKCDHPCIIKVVGTGDSEEHYNITMLQYCHGGDLFEFASKQRAKIKPFLLKRIYSEVVAAVRYLHDHYIVHRDIKLENVLLDVKTNKLLEYEETEVLIEASNKSRFVSDPIITLTDFGLSKVVDPNNVLLETRCGSEDYVAPELLMGLKYDGRQTDTWALGVLLYALMEGRLPFDPPPPTINPITGAIRNSRVRSRTAHRIARIEWAWYFFKDENSNQSVDSPVTEGVHDNDIGPVSTTDSVPNSPVINHYQYRYDSGFWEGAKDIVKNTLIKRDKRWTAAQVLESPWCRGVLPETFVH